MFFTKWANYFLAPNQLGKRNGEYKLTKNYLVDEVFQDRNFGIL